MVFNLLEYDYLWKKCLADKKREVSSVTIEAPSQNLSHGILTYHVPHIPEGAHFIKKKKKWLVFEVSFLWTLIAIPPDIQTYRIIEQNVGFQNVWEI